MPLPRTVQSNLFLNSLLIVLTLSAASRPVSAQTPAVDADDQLQLLGNIRDKDISESSGLAISAVTPNAFWTLNDSGHKAELFLVSEKGKTLATCELSGIRNRDWEAMGSFERDGQPWLMVADVGDNSLNRASCHIHLLPEPALCSADDKTPKGNKKKGKKKKKKKNDKRKLQATPQSLEFRYADGSHNVEAAAVAANGKSVWFIEKIYSNDTRKIQPGIYELQLDAQGESDDDQKLAVANRIADFPVRNVTGMSFSPDDRRLIVRNYLNAHLFTRAENQTWRETVNTTRPVPIPMPLQSQGEAICITADSKFAIITSEFNRSAIWKVALPDLPPDVSSAEN